MRDEEQQLNIKFDGSKHQHIPQEVVDHAAQFIQNFPKVALMTENHVVYDSNGEEYLFHCWLAKDGPYPPIDGPYVPSAKQRIKNFIKRVLNVYGI